MYLCVPTRTQISHKWKYTHAAILSVDSGLCCERNENQQPQPLKGTLCFIHAVPGEWTSSMYRSLHLIWLGIRGIKGTHRTPSYPFCRSLYFGWQTTRPMQLSHYNPPPQPTQHDGECWSDTNETRDVRIDAPGQLLLWLGIVVSGR